MAEQVTAKHTPGPWRFGEDEPDYLWSLHIFADHKDGDGDINIAWVSCSQDGAQSGEDAPRLTEALANARLIAAAPVMAEKLLKIVAWLDAAATRDEERAKDQRFKSLADACAADAKNFRAMAVDLRSALPHGMTQQQQVGR